MPLPPPPDLDFRPDSFMQALAALPPAPPPDRAAHDEAYWNAVAAHHDIAREPVNLEHGYWGVMAQPVLDTCLHWTRRVNHDNTVLLRAHAAAALDGVRSRVAAALGCRPAELALTRGASESLQVLLGGYNRLRPGDTVLAGTLDYPAAHAALQALPGRRGVRVVTLPLPDDATPQAVLQAYQAALRHEPRVRLVLLTHLSHRTGLVLPVAQLAADARAAGADVVLDAAQSWGQVPLDLPALGVDFAALTLHKWIGAPLGCGCLYVRSGRAGDVDPYGVDTHAGTADDVGTRVRTGTVNFAAWLSVPAALHWHRRIGPQAQAARLRHLRDHWVAAARRIPGVEVMTPDEPGAVGGITSWRLRGRCSLAHCQALVAALLHTHGIHTVTGTGSGGDDVIRVTPHVTTTPAELDRFTQALAAIAHG